MSPVAGALEVHHAVETGEGGAIALIAMGIKFLLGEDIPTALDAAVDGQQPSSAQRSGPGVDGRGARLRASGADVNKKTYLAGKRHHGVENARTANRR